MAEPLQIFTGTYGFTITIATSRDLSDALALRLRIRNPLGVNIDRALTSANILTPKTEGNVFYTVNNADFVMPGTYQIQLFDETSGRKLAASIIKIKVKASLDYDI